MIEVKRKLLRVTLVLASSLGLSVASTNLAHAGPGGTCASGEVCLYYNSLENNLNAYFVQTSDIPDYQGYSFRQSQYGSYGAGQGVKNNAAAVNNRSSYHFRVFYNSYYSCAVACQQIPSLTFVNLNSAMKNNNASGSM
ncbi:hypothetical protein ACH492_28700 [Streptomyces sp. NPDC019443]|uniref:hypothetical protein n=1 Tax=Streptomyces sp. NPDC019443 TaxID=3365061 RepID=UPI0037B48E46